MTLLKKTWLTMTLFKKIWLTMTLLNTTNFYAMSVSHDSRQ